MIEWHTSATSIEFPATCAADKCEETIGMENLFKAKAKKFRDIMAASLKSYIAFMVFVNDTAPPLVALAPG